MRRWTWIPTLLLATLLASPAQAQEQELACLDLLWELAFEDSVPDGELEAFVGCLDLVDEAVAEASEPEALDGCFDGFWSLIGGAPSVDAGVLTECVGEFEEALDPEPDGPASCIDILWGTVGVQADESVDPAGRTCVMQLEQVLAQDPAPVPAGVDSCVGSLWHLVNRDPADNPPLLESCLVDLEGWLVQVPAPAPQTGG